MTHQTSDELLCFVFDTPLAAHEAVLHLHSSGVDSAFDAIVGNRGADGDVRLTQTTQIESRPVIWPGAWPVLLVGTIYAASIAGAMWGISLAGLWSRLIEVGLDRHVMQTLADALRPGGSAAFYLIRTDEEDVITAAFAEGSSVLHRLAIPDLAVRELSSSLSRVDPRRLFP